MSHVSKSFGSREDLVFGAVIDEGRSESLEICILGKAELEQRAGAETEPTDEAAPQSLEALGLESEISRDNQPPRRVHQSKLRKKKEVAADQDEFNFIEVEAQRGYFEKTDRNLYKDQDLDVPTYLRKGIKIRIKV